MRMCKYNSVAVVKEVTCEPKEIVKQGSIIEINRMPYIVARTKAKDRFFIISLIDGNRYFNETMTLEDIQRLFSKKLFGSGSEIKITLE